MKKRESTHLIITNETPSFVHFYVFIIYCVEGNVKNISKTFLTYRLNASERFGKIYKSKVDRKNRVGLSPSDETRPCVLAAPVGFEPIVSGLKARRLEPT